MFRKLSILPLLLFSMTLYAQRSNAPSLDVKIQRTLDYERPARLKEEDDKKGRLFKFTTGLEIVTDIDAFKVSIFDVESGRTPYENNSIDSGYVRIKLEKPGFQDYSFWVNVKENYRTSVFVYYKSSSDSDNASDTVAIERKSSSLYKEINPSDPPYYRQIYFMNEADSLKYESTTITGKDGSTLITLSPVEVEGGNVFLWNGRDAEGNPVEEDEYGISVAPFESFGININHHYSRQALNYYSGFSGMVLVPSARLLFKRGFQFGSSFSLESIYSGSSHDYNLPFSFFMRLSPLKRWEVSVEAETAFVTEEDRPSLRINTSQKAYLFDIHNLLVSAGLRGSYKSAINDFSEEIHSSIIRDPSGVSLFVPVQFRIQGWDFLGSPELLYTLRPLSNNIRTDQSDITAALRWGVLYSYGSFFSAGLSSALYFPSYRGNPLSMQASAEVTFYVPGTPLYINLFGILQKVHGSGDGTIVGLNLGFVL